MLNFLVSRGSIYFAMKFLVLQCSSGHFSGVLHVELQKTTMVLCHGCLFITLIS